MRLTPNALSNKISELVKEGYTQKQAIAIAYSEMRKAWREKHPVGKFPSWLSIESRGKNPMKPVKKSTAWDVFLNNKWLDTVYFDTEMKANEVKKSLIEHDGYNPNITVKNAGKKNPVKRLKKRYVTASVSPDTTEIIIKGKRYKIYDAYPSLQMAKKYARDYDKSGMGKAVVRDLGEEAGRLRYALFVNEEMTRKNPVRRLKKQYYIMAKKRNKRGFYNGTFSLSDNIGKAIIYQHLSLANETKNKLSKNFPSWEWSVHVL